MIELIPGLPDDVLGLEARGEVTGEDYERVVIPAVHERLEGGGKLRLLYVLGPEFDGFTAAAMWDDAKVGMEHPFSWERIAAVTDQDAYRRLFKGIGFMFPAKIRVFDLAQLEDAKAWIAAE